MSYALFGELSIRAIISRAELRRAVEYVSLLHLSAPSAAYVFSPEPALNSHLKPRSLPYAGPTSHCRRTSLPSLRSPLRLVVKEKQKPVILANHRSELLGSGFGIHEGKCFIPVKHSSSALEARLHLLSMASLHATSGHCHIHHRLDFQPLTPSD